MGLRLCTDYWYTISKISEKLGRCGRQNMLWPYLNIWDWEWIFGRTVKVISSLGLCSPWLVSNQTKFIKLLVILTLYQVRFLQLRIWGHTIRPSTFIQKCACTLSAMDKTVYSYYSRLLDVFCASGHLIDHQSQVRIIFLVLILFPPVDFTAIVNRYWIIC